MKIITLAITALLCIHTSYGQSIVQLKLSKPYCLLNFAEAAAGNHNTSQTLKKHISGYIPAQDSIFYRLIDRYKNIHLGYSYEREEFPEGRRRHRAVDDLIKIAAVRSSDLQQFKLNTIGILPNSAHHELFEVLTALAPYYENTVWEKQQPKINDRLQAMNVYTDRADFLFRMFKTLYGSSWTDDIPFSVSLYPIPGRRGHTTASAHANSLCIGVLTDDTDAANAMGVVLHEMCHVLYDEQPAAFQHQLEQWFGENRSKYARYAYNYFDEGMATALGNGYAYQYINDKLDTARWYNNIYIDGFGHALYPLAARYISDNKTIDKAFVDEAISLFEKTFPDAPNDYGILLNRVDIYSDAETERDRSELFSAIGSQFQLTWTSLRTPVTDRESIAAMRNGKETQLIIIDKAPGPTIAALKQTLPELNRLLKDKKEEDFILSYYDARNRPVIIIKASNKGALDEAFAIMNRQRYIKDRIPYQSIKTGR